MNRTVAPPSSTEIGSRVSFTRHAWRSTTTPDFFTHRTLAPAPVGSKEHATATMILKDGALIVASLLRKTSHYHTLPPLPPPRVALTGLPTAPGVLRAREVVP